MDKVFWGIVITWLVAITGWCMNIYQVIQMSGGEITAKFIIKLIGIFAAPLGAVLGFIG